MKLKAVIAASTLCLMNVNAQAGQLQRFDYPGAPSTCGVGISSAGTVVGNTFTLSSKTVFFTWNHGHFTTLSPTLPAGFLAIPDINSHGVLTASVTTVSSSLVFQSTGFTLHRKSVTDVALPGAFSVAPTGINDSGMIVGWYQTSAGGPTLGFVQSGDKLTTLDGGTGFTVATSIDAAGGSVVGYTYTSPFTSGGAVPLYAGFLYRDHKFTTIAMPGADFTQASGDRDLHRRCERHRPVHRLLHRR
jgi:hypothetical protein